MTYIQICALISIIIASALLYWIGYRGGRTDGYEDGLDVGYDAGGCVGYRDGIEEGKAIQKSDSWGEIRDLELMVSQARENHSKLYGQYKRAREASVLGEKERTTLLAIADQLKLAAETFKALKSPEQEKRSYSLRNLALELAAPLKQEDAA